MQDIEDESPQSAGADRGSNGRRLGDTGGGEEYALFVAKKEAEVPHRRGRDSPIPGGVSHSALALDGGRGEASTRRLLLRGRAGGGRRGGKEDEEVR
jgi:hypothetical protein